MQNTSARRAHTNKSRASRGEKLELRPQLLDALFAQRSLIDGESVEQYEGFSDEVRRAIGPRDTLEEIWVRDVVDLAWEALRWRRWRAALLSSARPLGLRQLLHEAANEADWQTASRLLEAPGGDLPLAGPPHPSPSQAEAPRALPDLGDDAVLAVALTLKLPQVEAIDRLIASAEARRDRAVFQIERRRESGARRGPFATLPTLGEPDMVEA